MILRGFLAFETRRGLNELEEYLKVTEKYLKKAKSDFETHLDEQRTKLSTANLSPKELDEFNEFYGEVYWGYAETFPSILRSSFFVSAYSLLEDKMSIICRHLKKEQQIPISWSDLRGRTLDQFKLYSKLAGLELQYDDHTWQEIKRYSKVRNCIVHNSGLIEEFRSDKDFMRYISDNDIISKELIKEQIALTEQFCREVTKNIWAFLKKVLDAYESQKQNQKRMAKQGRG